MKNILFGIVFIGLGVYFFLTPEKIWKRNEAWKSWRAEEPSKAYLVFVRVVSVLMALAGIALLVLLIV